MHALSVLVAPGVPFTTPYDTLAIDEFDTTKPCLVSADDELPLPDVLPTIMNESDDSEILPFWSISSLLPDIGAIEKLDGAIVTRV